MITIDELKFLKESENKVEFKEAKGGNYSYNGGNKSNPKDRRKCILGYVTAFANEGGGYLVLGVSDNHPHEIVSTRQAEGYTGQLESDIYNDCKIRVNVSELYDSENRRVLILEIPPRPIGKIYKFEDLALMRVGEELLPMSEEKYLKIIQEQEPDFSSQVCSGVSISDLDPIAIQKLKEAYSEKQLNPLFLTLPNSQVLSDLDLIVGDMVTNAAIILLGKTETIKNKLPQNAVSIEYRNTDNKIVFDDRQYFQGPYFLLIENIWERINLRNGKIPVQQGPFIFDIPAFNKEVIREALNNAIAHRDYRKASDVVIKQYPNQLIITNPGGFPSGVNVNNLLKVNSTPRNRLLADVLAKTGIVERSGQGVDKIYFQCLSEAKGEPDYTDSDDFQVELKLPATVKDKAFALFIKQVQAELTDADKLSVQDIITLDKIREGKKLDLNTTSIKRLLDGGFITKLGKTNAIKYKLSKDYYVFANKETEFTKDTPLDEGFIFYTIINHLKQFPKTKMKDFAKLFQNHLTREQVKTIVYNLVRKSVIFTEGSGSGRLYSLTEGMKQSDKIVARALELGFEELKKRGEISDNETQN